MAIKIPLDFDAVVFTPPARVDHNIVPGLQAAVEAADLSKIRAHRIMYMNQVEYIDSAALVGLMTVIEVAQSHGMEFLACDPPPIVRSYLEIYGAAHLLDGRVLSANSDGTYESDLLPFVPPFVPHEQGRFDVYSGGKVRSLELAGRELLEIPPVDLNRHAPKSPARAKRMAVKEPSGERAEIDASGYVMLRRHMCGCDATHTIFQQLHSLHRWYQRKGFDFGALELWASDVPAGMVTERLTFRDRMHMDQFKTLLKIDQSWKQIGAPTDKFEEEFYYLY